MIRARSLTCAWVLLGSAALAEGHVGKAVLANLTLVYENGADGHMLGRLGPGESVRIAAATKRVNLIHPTRHDHYQMLRQKLRWGRGRHARPGDV